MKNRVSPRSRPLAFTLVELLTVIAIIAILMGLLFPAIAAIRENGRRAEARNNVMQILTAVKAYNTEYGKYPTVEEQTKEQSTTEDAAVGDEAAGIEVRNNALFNTLRAIDEGLNTSHKLNPRRVPFFEGRSVQNPIQPRSGFVDKGSEEQKGCFYDPWGKQFNVVIDSNYDNKVQVMKYYRDVPQDESPRTGVVSFALGKDNQLGEKGSNSLKDADDIVSWK
jgi:prepilin-type N-terminal cleavage/methylation domain-containing protein